MNFSQWKFSVRSVAGTVNSPGQRYTDSVFEFPVNNAMPNRRLLYLIAGLTDCAMMLLVFTVSRTLAEAETNHLTMGLLGGGVSISLALSAVLSGRISDLVGRRLTMFVGMVVMLLSLLGCLLLEPTQTLYRLAYVLIGVAAGMIYPSLIATLTSGSHALLSRTDLTRVLVFFCRSWNLGLIGGQLTGGWLFKLDPTFPLFLASALALTSFVLVIVWGPRASPRPATRAVATEPRDPTQNLSAAFARLAWIANLGGTFAMSMVFHIFPKLMVTLNIPAQRHGTLIAVSRIVVIGTYLLMHGVHFWHHRFRTTVISHLLGVAGLIVIVLAQREIMLLVGLAALAQLMGYNYFAGLYYTTSGADEARKGTATGIHEATLGIGFAGGSIFGGLVGEVAGHRAPYQLAAAVIATVLLAQVCAYWWHVRPLKIGYAPPRGKKVVRCLELPPRLS